MLTAPGPRVETHTPGRRWIWPLTSAMKDAVASWRVRTNPMPARRAASRKASTSAQVGIGSPILRRGRGLGGLEGPGLEPGEAHELGGAETGGEDHPVSQ